MSHHYEEDFEITNHLMGAKVQLDPCFERGRVCRGAYICSGDEIHYLDHSCKWTHGIEGPGNFWQNRRSAQDFLDVNRESIEREGVILKEVPPDGKVLTKHYNCDM